MKYVYYDQFHVFRKAVFTIFSFFNKRCYKLYNVAQNYFFGLLTMYTAAPNTCWQCSESPNLFIRESKQYNTILGLYNHQNYMDCSIKIFYSESVARLLGKHRLCNDCTKKICTFIGPCIFFGDENVKPVDMIPSVLVC